MENLGNKVKTGEIAPITVQGYTNTKEQQQIDVWNVGKKLR